MSEIDNRPKCWAN